MATEQDLLDAIRAAPDDDAPRLVYGDHLLAKNDPRGELIQVQCRLADEAITPSEHRRLRAVENKLVAAHGDAWNDALLDAIGPRHPDPMSLLLSTNSIKIEYRRGFVDSVRAPADVLQRLDAVFAAAPLITKLRLDPAPPYDRITTLDPSALASRHLENLQSFHVNLPGAGVAGAEAIAGCPHLSNVRALTLSISRWDTPEGETGPSEALGLSTRGARALASSTILANVKNLVLTDNRLGAEGVAALLMDPKWKLEELALGNNLLDDEAIATIAGASSLEGLKKLSLAQSSMTPETAAKLAGSKHLGRALTTLSLEDCTLGPKGIKAFLGAMGLEALTQLSIESTGLGDAGSNIVASSPKLLQLRIFNIRKNQITKKGLATLAASENLRNLEKILVHDRESKEAREAFLTSPSLANAQIYFRGKLLSRAAKAEKVEEKEAKAAKKPKAKAKKAAGK